MLPCLTIADHGLTMVIIKVDNVNLWSAVKYHAWAVAGYCRVRSSYSCYYLQIKINILSKL